MNDKNNDKSGREESHKPCEVNSCESNEVHSFIEIVTMARKGDRTSMGQLVEVAEPRLLAYIFRLTLSQDLSEELCQKTLVKMVQSLETLKNVDKFWYWLLRHAMGEVQHYYRDQKRRHEVEFEALNRDYFKQYVARNHHDGLDQSARIELSEIMYDAIARLKFTYRSILVLRCYEQLSFAEIAQLLNCKEFGARVLFYRAKHALRQHMSRHGFGKEMLLAGLGLFGILTLPTKATSTACSVNTASLNVGVMAALVGSLGTRLGIAIITSISAILAAITFQHLIVSAVIIAMVLLGLVIVGLYAGLD